MARPADASARQSRRKPGAEPSLSGCRPYPPGISLTRVVTRANGPGRQRPESRRRSGRKNKPRGPYGA